MAFSRLPGDVISRIFSLTTPRDACRVSSVSTAFRSIADSDQVWLQFLPPDHCDGVVLPPISPKKSLYLHLCDHPIPVGGNRNMSLSLDKKSGKKCFMLGARDLTIAWGDDRNYWEWIATPESRFNEVAQLQYVWWFHIIGRIETSMLSSGTNYAAYLVFRFEGHQEGFDWPVESHVCIGSEELDEGRSVTLDPREGEPRAVRERAHGWMEIELGEFRNENGDDGTLVCSLREVVSYKSGLVVEGIELRPQEMH
ncbi:F-box protein PP2-B11-like isoform X1 [Eucalyptus grandis]|uniref:F-box protein PP2-B11-like isoform X1 n=1 Tax=Eucalyptus grandis TaxID=71139 RepID=UPI00192F07F8|nr:F-box protein PP2-B11-like isoform X1 [Eucalyptus grandis]